MIKKETIVINEITYMRAYSDAGYRIERDGVRYDEAIDPLDADRNYIETDEPIVPGDIPGEDEVAKALDILMGVSG